MSRVFYLYEYIDYSQLSFHLIFNNHFGYKLEHLPYFMSVIFSNENTQSFETFRFVSNIISWGHFPDLAGKV